MWVGITIDIGTDVVGGAVTNGIGIIMATVAARIGRRHVATGMAIQAVVTITVARTATVIAKPLLTMA